MLAAVALAVLLAASGADAPLSAVILDVPEADRARLTRYVGIEAGQSLDPEAVRGTVERLYATGEFADVVVERRQGPNGLELHIRPVAAPRLSEVRVEGDKVVSTGTARSLSRLLPGETLWRERLDSAAQAVAVGLVERGYLEARVSARSEPDGARAAAVFRIDAGPRVRVSRADVQGDDPGLLATLRPLVHPRPGEPFVRSRAQKAADAMKRRLVDQSRWRASVQVDESYDPQSARMALVFHARPGPWMRVDFRGADASSHLRGAVSDLVRNGGASPDALDEGVERIEDDFRRHGYRSVIVANRSESAPRGEVIVYEITAGAASTVGPVSAQGLPGGFVFVPAIAPGTPLEERRVQDEAERLKHALEAGGYPESEVEADLPEGGGTIPVTWRVTPGPHVTVVAFSIVTPVDLPSGAGARELRTRIGQPYRISDLALDRNALLASWRNAGYAQVTIEPEVTFSEDRSEASVTLRVEPGQRIDVERIIVAGLMRTREVVVRRELLVKESEPLGLANLLESQRRLGALGLFRRLSITELPGSAGDRRNLVVSAEEAPATTFAYGLGYAEDDKVRGSIEVTRRNISGLDRTLSAFVRASARATRVFLSYREPYLFGHRHELFLTGFREEEARPGFDYIRGGGLVQTGVALSPRMSLILRYSYEKTNTFNVTVPEDEVDREFQDATFSGPSVSLIDDTRDDAIDPHRGHFLGADVRYSLKALGGDSFIKASLQGSTYRRATSRALVAVSGRIGLSRTFGFEDPTRLPLPERFFAGGDYSLRGFPTDGVDEAGGNGLLLGSVELRFDLTHSFALAAFTDAGNVYPFVSDMDLGDIRSSAGIGLRYKTAFGPLRVDWGFKLDRRPDESASHLHIAVGYAF